jgi:protein transport protein SEC24
MKLFDIIKNIFKVEKIDDINDELIDKYYDENMKQPETEEKTEEVVNEEPVKEEEKIEEIPETEVIVVEETPVEEEKTEEVVNEEPVKEEEKTEEVVNEEPVKEEEKIEDKKEEEVLTKEVINNAKGNIPMDKSDLMKLHGSEFFNALYKSRKNLM